MINQKKKKESITKLFLDKVIDMSPFAMWVSDPDGNVIRVNRSLCDALNLSKESIIGKYNIFNDKNMEKHGIISNVRAVFEELESIRFSIPWKANQSGDANFSSARDLYIDVSMFPITDVNGELTNVVCQWVDITMQKNAEQELKNHHKKLKELVKDRTAELETTTRELKEKVAFLERFHDATVEREIRMKDLMDRINKLENGNKKKS